MAAPNSLWLDEALADNPEVAPRLEGSEKADLCIVGGGYTGLWTALRLRELEPSLDVALIEKDLCGSGASGRNGGFITSWWAKFLSLQKICGDAEAVRLARASAAASEEIGGFCQRHGIDAHFRPDGWLWTATNEAQIGAWDETLEAAARAGDAPFAVWDRAEVVGRSGSERHLAGIFEPTAATVQPAHLVRGLRRVALERGVRIFEHTPLERLKRTRPLELVTPRGVLRAERVVLAMNAWSVAFSEIRKGMIVVTSDMVATPPIPAALHKSGWVDGLAISDSRALVHYYRTTRDGRIAFGKGGMTGRLPYGGRIPQRFENAPAAAAELSGWLRWTYPDLEGASVAKSWSGLIDRPWDGLPTVSVLGGRPDITYAVGFSGNGVGPCAVVSRMLASLALGREDEWSNAGLVRPSRRRFPPEPFRYLGAPVVRRAVATRDRCEDEGRRPGPLTRALARLAPAGFSPFRGQKP